jgi:UDP-N-acetyl-D-mannosaminuronate dehydrogenase
MKIAVAGTGYVGLSLVVALDIMPEKPPIADIGFKPNISLEDGIAKFVDWYKRYYK